jgi:hypothetical protein
MAHESLRERDRILHRELVPDPIEKCAECAASPSRTTLPTCPLSQRTSRKWVHGDRLLSTLAQLAGSEPLGMLSAASSNADLWRSLSERSVASD